MNDVPTLLCISSVAVISIFSPLVRLLTYRSLGVNVQRNGSESLQLKVCYFWRHQSKKQEG